MRKTLILAIWLLIAFIAKSQDSSNTVEGTVSGSHIVKSGFNNWHQFLNTLILVSNKNNATEKYYLYATNSNSNVLYVPGLNKLFDNNTTVIVKKLNVNINESGKVGVGVRNPKGTLHVKALTNNTNDGLTLESNIGNSIWKIHPDASESTGWGYKPLLFYNASTQKYVMNLSGNGNIGIGTNTPKHKLDVNGTIRAKEIIVEDPSTADFVFEDTYKLKSLREVEQFIKKNKHLPDVASAKQMKKNGVKQGEMNAKLLQKIEELTLYLIQLKKENEEMVEKNKQQDKIIKTLLNRNN